MCSLSREYILIHSYITKIIYCFSFLLYPYVLSFCLEIEFNEDNNRYFNGKLPEIIYLLPVNFVPWDDSYLNIFKKKEKT